MRLAEEESVDGVGQASCHLQHPTLVGRRRDASDMNAPGLQLDHEEDRVTNQASNGEDLRGEEVRGRESIPVRSKKCLPWNPFPPLRGGFNTVVGQDPRHGGSANRDADVRQRVPYGRVALPGILGRHFQHQFFDIGVGPRSADFAFAAAVVFAFNKLSISPQVGIWRDDAGDLGEFFPPQGVALDGEAPALGISQTKSSGTELFPKDAVLFNEVVDCGLLSAGCPPRDHQNHELEGCVHWLQSYHEACSPAWLEERSGFERPGDSGRFEFPYRTGAKTPAPAQTCRAVHLHDGIDGRL